MYLFVICCVINKMYWKFFIDENLWKNSSPLVYTFSTIVSLHATFLRPLKLLGFLCDCNEYEWIGIETESESVAVNIWICGQCYVVDNEMKCICRFYVQIFIYIVLFYRWKQKKLYLFWGKKHTHHITIYWWWFGSESDSWTVESKVKQCSGL